MCALKCIGKCTHFTNLNNLSFRRLINIGLSYIYERPTKYTKDWSGKLMLTNVLAVCKSWCRHGRGVSCKLPTRWSAPTHQNSTWYIIILPQVSFSNFELQMLVSILCMAKVSFCNHYSNLPFQSITLPIDIHYKSCGEFCRPIVLVWSNVQWL